ncbi:murein hydrolase activator EnvC family protein [Labrys wisconsinensis]|uniref:Septal ring factor EnvC (AmiA/AmiB activator) n=1 Tax=Labrys wisconsinensis TaxID=425677 RepID=A0ABU0J1U3_9HYPH|nr:murein hydrolase activator EnvC [Labrys wisconsinensis]MDQ0468219.1 septal ring factor EnvC (AmiA/AmiB activator) [Labrys wisconsinensis]
MALRALATLLTAPRLAAAGAVVCALAGPAAAETPAPPPAQAEAPPDAAQKRSELARLQDEIKLSDETVGRLQDQIRSLDTDRMKLRADLLETGARARDTEDKVVEAESRLSALRADEDTVKASLLARRGVLVEVLASLQRMGHHPPPALLVRPEDALEAVRSAMLLGAVLPEMRKETTALAADLQRLAEVRAGITAERDSLKASLASLVEDRKRIDLLVEEREKALAQQQRSLATEKEHSEALAHDASSLKDLIARMEQEVAASRDAAKAADAAAAKPAAPGALAALEDANRLSPARPFEKAKGMLPLPAAGQTLRRFGDDDGNGGVEKGIAIAPPPSATVTAPCDGWVVYAGPFRSYGQLLIINAGGGYHVVLAGMDKINVGLGQFVLTGEPVAAMGSGETRVASSTTTSAAQPTLYVEFRKDGVSIDPTPWWAKQGEKARG